MRGGRPWCGRTNEHHAGDRGITLFPLLSMYQPVCANKRKDLFDIVIDVSSFCNEKLSMPIVSVATTRLQAIYIKQFFIHIR